MIVVVIGIVVLGLFVSKPVFITESITKSVIVSVAGSIFVFVSVSITVFVFVFVL